MAAIQAKPNPIKSPRLCTESASNAVEWAHSPVPSWATTRIAFSVMPMANAAPNVAGAWE